MRWFVLVVLAACKDGAIDGDGDGYGEAEDCNDLDPDVHPGAVEVCDPGDVDEDCSGAADNADPDALGATPVFVDADADGYGASSSVTVCDLVAGYALTAGDCDDADPLVSPEAAEICDADGRDEDCDGLADDDDDTVDPSTQFRAWADADGDGFGDADVHGLRCHLAPGWVAESSDCDDGLADVHPGADELCGGGDEDCDGQVDEPDASDAVAWGYDADGDGSGDPLDTVVGCDAPEGYVPDASDCDDGAADVFPGADELCDGEDDDCDGAVDEDAADAGSWFRDADGDGHGDPAAADVACEALSGYVADASDCDDADATVHPDAGERCDALDADEDCDGLVDDADASPWGATAWYADADGDSYGNASASVSRCDAPGGYVADDSDCDDASAAVNPGAAEICDAADADEDCDGDADDASATGKSTWYRDRDDDGWGGVLTATACDRPDGYVAIPGDCDDTVAGLNPDAQEICDVADADEDCDGLADDASATGQTLWYADADGDGWGEAGTASSGCDAPSGYVADGGDCNDVDGAVNPGASEVCGDAVDDDCDGFDACDVDLSYAGRAFVGEEPGDRAGWAVASAGDVDADGIDDLLVGSILNDAGGADAGAAYLVHGGGSGDLDLSAADVIFAGEAAGDQAGSAVAGLGDVDGDGLPDLAVTAPSDDDGGTDKGSIYVVAGGGTDLATSWAKLVGDYPGMALTSVASAGDVDADGLGDLVAGCAYCDGDSGRVWVFTGIGAGTTLFSAAPVAIGGHPSSTLGSATGVGDTDGDGIDDLVVGAPNEVVGGIGTGAVYLFQGPITAAATLGTADAVRTGGDANDSVGDKVAAAGDVDGDGYADVLASGYNDSPALPGVRVFLGPLTGTATGTSAAALVLHSSTFTFDGWLAGGGDLNRDGYDDVALGDYADSRDDSMAGRVFLWLGPLSGTLSEGDADADLVGGAPNEYAGYALAFVGAQDGGAGSDLLVGAPADATGGAFAGAAFLFSAADL